MKTKFTAHFSKFPHFLYLLPLFFVFHAYAYHFPLISVADTLQVLLHYFFAVIILYLFFLLLFKSGNKSALFVIALLFIQLFFGTILNTIKNSFLPPFLSKYVFLVPFFVVVLALLFVYILKTQKKFDRAFRYLNILLLVLISIETLQLTSKPKTYEKNSLDTQATNEYRPDIYFILADEYAGKKQLAEVFQFDNSPFENELKKRGFYIVEDSKANYNYTPVSLASILDMNYIEGITQDCRNKKNSIASFRKINTGSVYKELAAKGYSFVNNSIFEFAKQPARVDNMFFSTRKKLITSQTFTDRFMKDVGFNFVTRYKISGFVKYWAYFTLDNNRIILDETIKEAKKHADAPRFIYTHQTMPHYPYYFNKDGQANPLADLEEGQQINQKNYLGYLQFANKKYLELIDTIKSAASKPPVIVFMGDHGFRHFPNPTDSTLQFFNISAVYLPGKDYRHFYPGMSGVNQFRIIFNTIFREKRPVLKDSTVFLYGF